MAVLRHEKQQYATPAALSSETIAPTANDSVFVESLRRTFDWIEGSSTASDNVYVIDQVSQTANGRWQAATIETIYTATAVTTIIDNGQMQVLDITVSGVFAGSACFVAITNADTFPDNVFIVSKEVIADDTVRIVVENQTGHAIPVMGVNVAVLEIFKSNAAFNSGFNQGFFI